MLPLADQVVECGEQAAERLVQRRGVLAALDDIHQLKGDAKALGIDPVVDFYFDPATLKTTFDLVLDTAGTMPVKAARTLLTPGGHIVDINVSPSNMAAKMARSVFSGDYQILVAQDKSEDLEEVARAAVQGELNLPVARVVPLTQAIDALTELERTRTPKRKATDDDQTILKSRSRPTPGPATCRHSRDAGT